MREIKTAIRKLKNNKASGSDLISNEMLKLGTSQLTPLIQKLFNQLIDSGQFPKEWNKTYQVPIFKSGEKTDCGNYRGISICSCFGKLFTSIMQTRLLEYLETENKLSKFQTAFRKGYGTTDHIFSLRSLINKYVLAKKKKLYTCFVDFRRAFPSVWRNAMLLKVLRLGIGGKFYNIIKSIYQEDSCYVKLPDGITPPFQTEIGIKQGDSLSPLLFCIFIDDVVGHISPTSGAPRLANQEVSCLIYADDLVLISKSEEGMQDMLGKLNNFCSKWHLEINTKKTKVMIFHKNSKKANQDNYNFHIGEHRISLCHEYTYLGVKFTRLGHLKEAATQLKDKAQKAWFSVRSTLSSNKIHKPQIWTKLFNTIVKPILTYGGEIWIQDFVTSMCFDVNKWESTAFERAHTKACRNTLGIRANASGIAARAELGRYPIFVYLAHKSLTLYARLLEDESKLVYNALTSEIELHDMGEQSWITAIEKICNTTTQQPHQHGVTNIQTITQTLQDKYKYQFFKIIQSPSGVNSNSGNKLRTYAKLKTDYELEKYLTVDLSQNMMREIARLRTSTHKLAIETGRYQRPVVPSNERLCKICNMGQVEDEVHFITKCTAYSKHREVLLSEMNLTNYNKSPEEKFIKIMKTSKDTEVIALGRYILACLQSRKNSNQSQQPIL